VVISIPQRLKTGIESIKKEIENHLAKLEKDISEDNLETAEYHSKEIEYSLIKEAEHKLNILDQKDPDIEKYKQKLSNLRKKFHSD